MKRPNYALIAALSMISVGVNILTHAHDVTEILQFTGTWLAVLGGGVLVAELIFILSHRDRP